MSTVDEHPDPTPRPFWALAVVHARFQFLETIRIPIAVIGNLLFPSLALLFFVIPQRAVADDPRVATAAVAQLGVVRGDVDVPVLVRRGRLRGPRACRSTRSCGPCRPAPGRGSWAGCSTGCSGRTSRSCRSCSSARSSPRRP